MITWRMAAAWVAALVLATVLTWQIVGLADSQVGDPPVAVAPSLASSTTGVTVASSAPSSTTSTSPTTTASSSTSSSDATTSSSTGASQDWSVRTINSPGGVVVVRFRPGEVELQAATPAPGFGVEVDEAGPPRVRVEFESDDDDYRVEARWENGALQVEVDD